MELSIQRVDESQKKTLPHEDTELGFGRIFTDHMFVMEYQDGQWQSPRIQPYQDFHFAPSTLVLHYGQGIFEGMKAYRNEEKAFLFRPRENLKRMNRSAERLVMPTFDEDFVLRAIRTLVWEERAWIPRRPGAALYIRPTMIATEAALGVKPSNSFLFFVILCPVGAYYSNGFNPVGIYVADEYVRAVPGGVGEAKTMGNYAASLLAAKKAQEAGFNQVLWLDGKEHRYLEEVGTMNLFVRFKDSLATPALTGSILPGVTRDSVLHLTRDWGMPVEERAITIDEVLEGIESGAVEEVFGTGTAAIISPVGKLHYKGKTYTVGEGKTGGLAQKLFDTLTAIQYARTEDPYGWVEELC